MFRRLLSLYRAIDMSSFGLFRPPGWKDALAPLLDSKSASHPIHTIQPVDFWSSRKRPDMSHRDYYS
jgi:hypothetical protein